MKTVDTIIDLLKNNGGSVVIDKPETASIGYEYSDGTYGDDIGKEYEVCIKKIYLKENSLYAECVYTDAESDIYEPLFSEERRLRSSEIEKIDEETLKAIHDKIQNLYNVQQRKNIAFIEEFLSNTTETFLQESLSKVLYTYLNTSQNEAESSYPLGGSINNKKLDEARTESNNQEYKNTLTLIVKYCSLSDTARIELNLDLDLDTAQKLNYLSMIRENPDCLPNLRLQEQEKQIANKKAEFSDNLNACKSVFPGTCKRLWDRPPYIITDVKFSTPPYAEGKPLYECPGWQGMEASFGHIDSISIKNGNGTVKTISGKSIDAENRIVFELEDWTVKYGIKDGKVEYIPHPKKDESQDLQQTMGENLSQSEVRGPHIR